MGGASPQVLSWDVLSNLASVVNTQGTVPAEDDVVHTYLYDASGQRFAQLVNNPEGVADTATVYMGGWEATDPNTGSSSTGDTVLTRLYDVGGAQVAHAEAGSFTFVLGDVQGSAQVAVTGTSAADAGTVTRNAYTPYGMTRDADHLTSTRGWLNQHEDTTTGLTYLNARYYDPALGRFLTPDPLMNPGDPRTLDPYRYADNNPVVYVDASGLAPCLSAASSWGMGVIGISCGKSQTGANNVGQFSGGFAEGSKAHWMGYASLTTMEGRALAAHGLKTSVQTQGWKKTAAATFGGSTLDAYASAVSLYKGDYRAAGYYAASPVWDGVTFYAGSMLGGASVAASVPVQAGRLAAYSATRTSAVVGSPATNTADRISGPLWSTTKSKTGPQNALRHFNDHGADFPHLNNAAEYVADAQQFLRTPPSGALSITRTNGDVVRYDPGRNIFGVVDSSGAPKTYFKPDPAQHGYSTNLDYFNAQNW